uniref:Uncharacterized protein n=1 Tax=Chromera velia CCMP2878 TaxID=1169474 RepID=A0A0G4I1V0_9ALVE|eukprot:Cvel_10221.t1-p1 / transcript=Cvel_10221.t1 / gene=Cvel_10221 / organism=Chromera_velia_CCMP2878 / gene_product=hypothetical protein / transcript_product=hypothetical protein / location=Cvel_scaffold612:5220-8865(-) / protein_length=487 / sequence_SO=supercontig / SO=protein_coding / is_pseudo=false
MFGGGYLSKYMGSLVQTEKNAKRLRIASEPGLAGNVCPGARWPGRTRPTGDLEEEEGGEGASGPVGGWGGVAAISASAGSTEAGGHRGSMGDSGGVWLRLERYSKDGRRVDENGEELLDLCEGEQMVLLPGLRLQRGAENGLPFKAPTGLRQPDPTYQENTYFRAEGGISTIDYIALDVGLLPRLGSFTIRRDRQIGIDHTILTVRLTPESRGGNDRPGGGPRRDHRGREMRGGDRGEEEKEIGNMEEQEKDEQLPEGWEYAKNVKAIWPPPSKEETRKIDNCEQIKTLEGRLREATEAMLKGKELLEGVKWEGEEERFEEIYAEWARGIREVLGGVLADTTRCVYPPDKQKDEGAYRRGQIQGTDRGGETGGTNGRGWRRLVQRHRAPRVVGAQRRGGCRRFPGTVIRLKQEVRKAKACLERHRKRVSEADPQEVRALTKAMGPLCETYRRAKTEYHQAVRAYQRKDREEQQRCLGRAMTAGMKGM